MTPDLASTPLATLDAVPDPVWIADRHGAVIHVNARWCALSGQRAQDALGDGWTDVIAPHQRAAAQERWHRAVNAGAATHEAELLYRASNGGFVWYRLCAVAERDERGEPQRWFAIHTNIDRYMRHDASLGLNTQTSRVIAESTHDGVWIIDTDARIRYVNARLCGMLGYDAGDLYGRSAPDFLAGDDRERFAEWFAERRAGRRATHEACLLRRDGSLLYTIAAANPLFDEAGAFAGAMVVLTDISERKSMELQLARAAAEYRTLTEAMPQIVWTADAAGRFDFLNARWTDYTGIERAQARGWGWIAAVHRDDLSAVMTAWRTTLDSEADFEAPLRLRRSGDGSYRWFSMRARVLRDAGGVPARWFGTLTDIHAERRTARQLEIVARTSTVLADSLDRDALMNRLAELVCAELANFCLIVLIDDDRRLNAVGSGHRDPRAAAELRGLHRRPLAFPSFDVTLAARIMQGTTFSGTLDPQRFTPLLEGDCRQAMLEAGAGGFICAPLVTRGRTIGALIAFAHPRLPFNDDDSVILTEIAGRAAVAVENAELYAREHRVSATLQQALLPATLPTIPGVMFDAIYEPGATEAEIGGDWYDGFALPDGRVIVSIGDVTGRGLIAAVIMGRMRQAIEALAAYAPDPAQLLDAADAVLRRTEPDAIVTALVGVIDRTRHTFAYATAGHPLPIVRAGDGTIVTLPGSGLPLGLRDAHQPPTSTLVLPPDAMLVLFTDGLVESTRRIDEGERRLLAALANPAVVHAARPAAALKAAVLHDGSNDDVAVFTIRVSDAGADAHAAPPWTMRWTFDARDSQMTRAVRELFTGSLRARGAPGGDIAGAELIFGELLGNVVRYAPGDVDVDLTWEDGAAVLHVLDRGPGYERAHSLPAQLSETGRGLFLVSTLAREFTVRRRSDGGSYARAVLAVDLADGRRPVR